MYHTTDRPATGRVVLVQGAIFGGIMSGIKLVITLIDVAANISGRLLHFLFESLHLMSTTASLMSSAMWTIVYGMISLVVFFFAGMQATKRTGKMETGVLAGLVGGGVYGIFSLLLALVLFFTITLPFIGRTYPTGTGAGSIATSLLVSIVTTNLVTNVLIVGLMVGALAGLLGGAIGQSSARRGMPPQYGAVPMMPPPPGQPYGAMPVPPPGPAQE